MVQNCSIWHQWSGGYEVLVDGRGKAAPGDRRGRGSTLGHDMTRPAEPMEAQPTTKGTVGRGDWVGCLFVLLVCLVQAERGRVDAVAQAGRGRAVGKHVAQVGITTAAGDLCASHPVAGIALKSDVVLIQWLPEARPARARVKFRLGAEQWLAAAHA